MYKKGNLSEEIDYTPTSGSSVDWNWKSYKLAISDAVYQRLKSVGMQNPPRLEQAPPPQPIGKVQLPLPPHPLLLPHPPFLPSVPQPLPLPALVQSVQQASHCCPDVDDGKLAAQLTLDYSLLLLQVLARHPCPPLHLLRPAAGHRLDQRAATL